MLLFLDDPAALGRLSGFLKSRGLEVVRPRRGMGPMDALNAEAPDAVVLELAGDGETTLAAVEKMRGSRLYAGLPVFVLVPPALPQSTRARLRDLAAVVVPRDEPVEALEDLLGVLFPVADAAERSV